MASCRTVNSTHSDGDSDSDWDDDDDFASKKITIKIKPIAQVTPSKISASVDELRATVGTWKSLANINLVKPNSRRHHQSTVQLSSKLPVAFAIQECLNGKLYKLMPPSNSSQTLMGNNNNNIMLSNGSNSSYNTNNTEISLIGHLKMAVPPKLATMEPGSVERFLEFELISSIPWDIVRLNENFMKEKNIEQNNNNNNNNRNSFMNPLKPVNLPFAASSASSSSSLSTLSSSPANLTKRFIIDMESIQAYVKLQYQKQPNSKYYLIPELLKYQIGSQNNQHNDQHQHQFTSFNLNDTLSSSMLTPVMSAVAAATNPHRLNSPINVLAHWLCDLTITKVRIDIQFIENIILDNSLCLFHDDIKNLKISLNVNGGVTSYQSKPEANWNALDSKLTWSFSNLNELISKATSNGMTSCLARLNLNDGPSMPSDVNIEFSIIDKTLTGTQIILNNETSNNYRIVKQKYEVRTGLFEFKSPCI